MDGLWSSPDLAALLRLAALNREALALSGGWFRVPAQLAPDGRPSAPPQHEGAGAGGTSPPTTTSGNDFYRLFLDETMTYSSAVFAHAGPVPRRCPAEQVPARRGRRRARAGAARPRDRHGLGRVRPATRRASSGCRVTTITISQEQHDLAGARVRGGRSRPTSSTSSCATTATSTGTYDAIVSIEMLEAVGAEYLATFFEACDRALRPGGRLSLQVDHLPGCRLRARSSAARTGSRPTSSRAGCARRWRSSSGRPATPGLLDPGRRRHRRATTS